MRKEEKGMQESGNSIVKGLGIGAWAQAYADFDEFRKNSIESVEFGRIWQNSIKASDSPECDILCRVFHQDILTVTRLVLLH